MSDTNVQILYAAFGANITPPVTTVANRGFTAGSMTCPNEGFSTNKSIELINGLMPASNSSTQTLTVPNISVDELSSDPVVISIRPNTIPNNANTTNNSMYRVKTSSSTALESMDYNSVSTLDVDMSSYLFSGVTLGSKFPLWLTGNVTVAQPASYGLVQSASGTAITGPPITYSTTTTALTGAATNPVLLTDTTGSVYGYWPVVTTIQSMMGDYESFILKAGSPVLGDDVLQTLDGKAVKFSLMDSISSGGTFLNDFLVSSTTYQIVKMFLTTNIWFAPSSKIPEGTTVGFGAFVPGSNTGVSQGVNQLPVELISGSYSTGYTTKVVYFQYAYGAYPQYQIPLYEGSKIDTSVTIRDGYSLPAGFVADVGSYVNDKDGANIASNLLLTDVRGPEGTLLPPLVVLHDLVLTGDRARIPAGETSSQMQNLLIGSKTYNSQTLDGIIFPVGGSLPSDLEFLSDFELDLPINATQNTKVSAGSILPKDSISLEGATIKDGFVIAQGSPVTDQFDVTTSFVVTASNIGGAPPNPLGAGATLRAPFVFPIGTQIPNDNTLPATFKILMSMGLTLNATMEIEEGSVFGPSANLYGNIGFSPTGLIPALSTLHGNFNIPIGSKIEKDSIMNVPIPLPPCRLHINDTLYAGTSIREGTPLPPVLNLIEQAGAAFVYGGQPVGPLTMFTDATSGITYLVVKGGTTFMSGFYFPVGCVLSKQATPGTTGLLGDVNGGAKDHNGGAPVYTLDAGEGSGDTRERAPMAQDFTFTPGTSTSSLVVALTDITFASDMLLQYDMLDADVVSYLALQEGFSLKNDLVLTSDYVVTGNKSVMWPANHPIPFDFVFTSSFNFTTPTATGTPLNKNIQFNTRTTEEYFYGVVSDSSSYIKLPFKGYKLLTAIKLAVNQAVASSGSTSFKSTVELAKGTKLLTTPAYITIQQPMQVDTDFIIGATMTTFPRILLPHGISLLSGQTTPGEIPIGAGQGLPKNIRLSSSVTLAADHIVSELTYTFPQYTLFAAGSTLARRTTFPTGLSVDGKVKLSPFLSLGTNNIFMINEDNTFTSDITYPYLTSSGNMPVVRTDSRSLLADFAKLQGVVDALQAQLDHHQ